jgi:DNA-binding CsgD family transcriptional regulator
MAERHGRYVPRCRAEGAVLLQSDLRTPDVPRTPAISDAIDAYFRDGWHRRDVRAERGVPLVHSGQPVVTDKRVLAQICRRLSDAATLSKAVSRSVLTGTTNALNLVPQPAMIIDRLGFVLDTNAAAHQLGEIRVHNRRLCIADKCARAEVERFVDAISVAAETDPLPADPIVVRRQSKPPILIRDLPIEAAARSLFLGARALLMFFDVGERSVPHSGLLARAFGLTAAEAKLASLIGAGESIERAAEYLDISSPTGRGQLLRRRRRGVPGLQFTTFPCCPQGSQSPLLAPTVRNLPLPPTVRTGRPTSAHRSAMPRGASPDDHPQYPCVLILGWRRRHPSDTESVRRLHGCEGKGWAHGKMDRRRRFESATSISIPKRLRK